MTSKKTLTKDDQEKLLKLKAKLEKALQQAPAHKELMRLLTQMQRVLTEPKKKIN